LALPVCLCRLVLPRGHDLPWSRHDLPWSDRDLPWSDHDLLWSDHDLLWSDHDLLWSGRDSPSWDHGFQQRARPWQEQQLV
jgi:hypothetical protein